jgi:hypothetical protein
LLAEQTADRLDRSPRRPAALVQKWIEFDNIDGSDQPGVVQQLHDQTRFAVTGPANASVNPLSPANGIGARSLFPGRELASRHFEACQKLDIAPLASWREGWAKRWATAVAHRQGLKTEIA